MSGLKIGLLPLYIKLYDDSSPELRIEVEHFLHAVEGEFEKRGVKVIRSGVCRIRSEFEETVGAFEDAGVDAIVTLHLAYSPSLESAEVLARTKLPIVVLDTTPDFLFDSAQESERINYNHGIHGVQDMCNLLIRNGKPFEIEAGHWNHSDVIDRVVAWVRAAHMAGAMRHMRVGRIGGSFAGMGDFAVPVEVMRDDIGIETVEAGPEELAGFMEGIADGDVRRETEADRSRFDVKADPEALRVSVKTGLAMRRWAQEMRLGAYTVNFMKISRASGLPVVPFLEACKALAAGTGYAGEGDVLTAALVGACLSVYPESTFVEMFCPDWANDQIFISHMGEMNVNLCASKPTLRDVPYPYTDAGRPVIACGRYRAGEATLANLAPMPGGRYRLILVPVCMLDAGGEDRMQHTVRGWFQPPKGLQEFLPEYSRYGGTHHSALIYGNHKDDLLRFGIIMGWDVKEIEHIKAH